MLNLLLWKLWNKCHSLREAVLFLCCSLLRLCFSSIKANIPMVKLTSYRRLEPKQCQLHFNATEWDPIHPAALSTAAWGWWTPLHTSSQTSWDYLNCSQSLDELLFSEAVSTHVRFQNSFVETFIAVASYNTSVPHYGCVFLFSVPWCCNVWPDSARKSKHKLTV